MAMDDTNNGVANFETNGFAGPIPVLSANEAHAALAQAMEEQELHGNDRFKMHLFLSEINRIVHNPALVQAVRQALKTHHIALWSSDINIKQPHSQQYFSAHQDATYTGLNPANQCLTAWIALSDPVGMEEGCMSFVRGSHKAGQLPHVEEIDARGDNSAKNANEGNQRQSQTTRGRQNMLSRGQRVQFHATNIDDWVAIPLRAGEATLHHFHTIHKSGFNLHPTQPRVGLALRYMAACVRQTGPVRECITWIEIGDADDETTGSNEKARREMERYFDLEPVLPVDPSADDIEAGRRAHSGAMCREASNYFYNSTAVKAYDEARSDRGCVGTVNSKG